VIINLQNTSLERREELEIWFFQRPIQVINKNLVNVHENEYSSSIKVITKTE